MKFQTKKTKEFILYSTAHHKDGSPCSRKLRIAEDYNRTKFGVDIFDQMTRRYAYLPSVRRWPLRLFINFIDAAAINAYVLFSGKMTRQDFIDKLSDQLMRNQMNLYKQKVIGPPNRLRKF